MRKIDWKLMGPEDIEVRVQSINNGKATMLLYQNARTAMDAFDEQFGPFDWKVKYEVVGGQIYGVISVYDHDKGEWVDKSDTGAESNIEKEKGLSSDIFKRCAVRWGFARELYTAPKITIDDDGYKCTGYRVSDVQYNERREMTYLRIVNRFGKEAFVWKKDEVKTAAPTVQVKADNNNVVVNNTNTTNKDKAEEYKAALTTQCTALKNTGIDSNEILKFFNYYTKAIEQGWKGKEFRPENLWVKWNTPKTAKAS